MHPTKRTSDFLREAYLGMSGQEAAFRDRTRVIADAVPVMRRRIIGTARAASAREACGE
jgi:hypothetical protein